MAERKELFHKVLAESSAIVKQITHGCLKSTVFRERTLHVLCT